MILLIMFLIQTILEEGASLAAEDGLSALAQLNGLIHICVDVMIPGMDGFEVTQRIRQHTKLSFIDSANHRLRPA